ncbi:MAG: nitronate monooxygenase, partial [Thermoplasmata archaeon]|nr:nitronate monooxygenase [Thermoplasmata archaeon]
MLKTRFTELVGCTVPLQRAGIGYLAMPRLAAAVANAGGLGMLGLSGVSKEIAGPILEETRRLTDGALGANFIIPFIVHEVTKKLDPDCAGAIEAAASNARVVEFFYDRPDPSYVEMAHVGGALAAWQVGSLDEAIAAERAGCDFVIAQGTEAGGHVRGT